VDYVKVDVVFIGVKQQNDAALRKALETRGIPHITCASTQDMRGLASEMNHMHVVQH
jgi:hypothetical protein